MKYIHLSTLFLMLVCHTSCGQNKTDTSKGNIKSETKDVITRHGPNTSVRAIRQDRKGNIWLASNEGIIRYDGKSFTNITGNLSPDRFFSVLEDRKGNFWFGNYGSGVYYFDGKSFQHFTTREGLANNLVMSICEDKDGVIWFGTGGGLSRYDGKSFRNYMMKGDTAIENRTGSSSSNFTNGYGAFPIIEDKSGRLWFGTNSNTFIYDGRTFAIFRNNEGKAFKNVWSIIEDKKGNIWLGGDDGLWRYDGSTFANFTRHYVRFVYEDKKGNIWTSGSNDNGKFAFSRYDEKSLSDKKPTVTEITQSLNLFGILEANDGSIWFGAFDGVHRYDGKTITDFKSAAGQK